MTYLLPTPSAWSLILFLCILLFVWAYFLWAVLTSNKSVLIAFSASIFWFALLGAVVQSGIIEAMPFPRLPMFAGLSLLAAVIIGLSALGRAMANAISVSALIAFQAFRFPLELVLHDWSTTGTIPQTMTYLGQNFDIVTGILAIVFLPFVRSPLSRTGHIVAWCFNVIGFALLVNVGRVAVMSSPLPFSWNLERPLVLAFHLPYAMILPIAVAGALLGHILLTRKLLSKWMQSS